MSTTPNNETIIRSVLSGAREEFGLLVERYLPMVHAVAHAHMGTMGDVDDLAQDSFVCAFRFLHTLRDPAKFPAWLATITRNTCSRHAASYLRARHGEQAWKESAPSIQFEDPAQNEIHTMVEQAVRELDVPHREILLLYYFSKKDLAEIEATLEISHENAKKRLQRARAALEAHLIEKLDEVLEAYIPRKEKAGAIIGAIALAQPKWVAPVAGSAGIGSLYSLWGLIVMSKKLIAGLAAILAVIGIGLGVSYSAFDGSSDTPTVGTLASGMEMEFPGRAATAERDRLTQVPGEEGANEAVKQDTAGNAPVIGRVRSSGGSQTNSIKANGGPPAKMSQRSAMVGGNPQHTGFYDVHAPLTKPKVAWEKLFGGADEYPGTAVAIDAAGRIFANHGAKESNWLAALSPEGELLWEYGPISAGKTHAVPTMLQNGNVLQKFRDGSLTAVDPATGDAVWSLDVIRKASECPVVDSHNNIYVPAASEFGIIKVDGNTGQIIWPEGGINPESNRFSIISPVLSDDEQTLYAGRSATPERGLLVALNADDGVERWSYAPGGVENFLDRTWAAPTVGADGAVYIQDAWSGLLYAVADEGTTGTELWAYDPASVGIVHRYEDTDRYVWMNESSIYPHDAPRAVATDGDAIFMGVHGSPASVHAVNVDGTPAWHTALQDEAVVGSPVVTAEAVYVLGGGDDNIPGHNALYCLDRNSGGILWDMPIARPHGDTGESIALAPDGTIYVISQSLTDTGVVVRALR